MENNQENDEITLAQRVDAADHKLHEAQLAVDAIPENFEELYSSAIGDAITAVKKDPEAANITTRSEIFFAQAHLATELESAKLLVSKLSEIVDLLDQ